MDAKNLLLLFLVTISSLSLSFAQIAHQPTPQLKEICEITKEPELCLQSYFVYTGEDHPDASVTNRAVLRKELEVANKMTLDLYTQSITFSSQHYGNNKRLYGVFDRCSRMFVLASHELIRAKEALLKLNDLDRVKAGINVAVNNYRTCDRSFQAEKLYKMADICLSLAHSIR